MKMIVCRAQQIDAGITSAKGARRKGKTGSVTENFKACGMTKPRKGGRQ